MRAEFVRFFTDDHVELQGLYFAPPAHPARAGVVYVHGLSGSFYEHPFVDHLAQTLSAEGYAFLSFNNRGLDYVSDLRVRQDAGWTYEWGGGGYEVFAECLNDIDAALQFVQDRGVVDVCLLGHSLGANKVVFTQSQRQDERVRGLILLSPNDDVGLQRNAHTDDFADVLKMALTMVEEGHGDALMPEGSFFSDPISAWTYVDTFGPDTRRDTFPFRNPEAEFEELSTIECPIFIRFGNVHEYVLGDLEETLSLLERKAAASPRVDTGIVDGAPHTYLGREEELSRATADWLREVMPGT